MQITKRRGAAIAVGLLLATTCFAAQPALAQQQGKKVTSQQIKDNTIQLKDLNSSVRAKIALGASALQSIADGSITTDKLADNAVTSPKIADDSVSAADLAANSVTSAELANNSVDTGAVADGSLLAADVAAARGNAVLDFPSIGAGTCSVLQIATGNVLDNDLILLTAPPTIAGIIDVDGRQASAGSANIAVLLCNHAAVALNPASSTFAWAILEN